MHAYRLAKTGMQHRTDLALANILTRVYPNFLAFTEQNGLGGNIPTQIGDMSSSLTRLFLGKSFPFGYE